MKAVEENSLGGGVFSVVGFWVQMITALSIVWKTRKRQRLFLTSSWLPADTSVCSHPVTGWPPHHRNNPLIEKRAPRCKLQPSTWPRKTTKKKKKRAITRSMFPLFFNNLMVAAPALFFLGLHTTRHLFSLVFNPTGFFFCIFLVGAINLSSLPVQREGNRLRARQEVSCVFS